MTFAIKHQYYANVIPFSFLLLFSSLISANPSPLSTLSLLSSTEPSVLVECSFSQPQASFINVRGLWAASIWPPDRHWLTMCRCLVGNSAVLLVVIHLLVAVCSVLAPPFVHLCLDLGLLFTQCLGLLFVRRLLQYCRPHSAAVRLCLQWQTSRHQSHNKLAWQDQSEPAWGPRQKCCIAWQKPLSMPE